MARFYPDKYLATVLPDGFEEKGLLFDNLHPRKMYLRALYQAAGKEGKALASTVNETIRAYQKKEAALKAAGVADYTDMAVNNQALLKKRVENFLIWNKVQEEKEAHGGQFYRWLPSDAKNPDPEHQLLYGKVFRVGTGDKAGNMPGERYGCRCGIEWLNSEKRETQTPQERILQRMNPDFVQKAQRMFDLAQQGLHKQAQPLPFQTVGGREAKKIKAITGLELKKGKHIIVPDGVRHTWWRHGNPIKEAKRKPPQIAVTSQDIALIPEIVRHYDAMELSKQVSRRGRKILIYTKRIGNKWYTYLEEIWKRRIYTKTMYIKK